MERIECSRTIFFPSLKEGGIMSWRCTQKKKKTRWKIDTEGEGGNGSLAGSKIGSSHSVPDLMSLRDNRAARHGMRITLFFFFFPFYFIYIYAGSKETARWPGVGRYEGIEP